MHKRNPRKVFGMNIFFRRLKNLVRKPVFLFVTFWGHTAIIAGTAGFYYFEKGTNPKIVSFLDTLYWSISTVTTVGDGDVAPLTEGGKIIGICMMIVGSLFLWSYTALFAGGLMAPEIQMVEDEVRGLERDMVEVEKEMKIDDQMVRALLVEVQALRRELRDHKGTSDGPS